LSNLASLKFDYSRFVYVEIRLRRRDLSTLRFVYVEIRLRWDSSTLRFVYIEIRLLQERVHYHKYFIKALNSKYADLGIFSTNFLSMPKSLKWPVISRDASRKSRHIIHKSRFVYVKIHLRQDSSTSRFIYVKIRLRQDSSMSRFV
jgi:hypothetical protein